MDAGYDPYAVRGTAERKKRAGAATVRIKSGDVDTGDIPLETVKSALKVMKRRRAAPEAEMFSEEETGEAAGMTVAANQLRSLVERIERLNEDKAELGEDIKQVFAEAKGAGFDTKAIRTIIRMRKMDQGERQEAEAIVDLYKAALGMA